MYQLPYTLLPPYELPHFGLMEKVFSDEEIERIRFYEKIIDFAPATVIGEQLGQEKENKDIPKPRIAELGSLPHDENTAWLWQKIGELTAKANYDLFMYDIEFLEDLNYIRYIGEDNGHYVAHRDTSLFGYRKYDRKISGILMLSNPDEYEGGQLLIDLAGGHQNMDTWQKVDMKKGDCLFFDSQFIHSVQPVTSGKRQVVVFWAHGQVKI